MKSKRTFNQILFIRRAQGKNTNLSILYSRITIDGQRTEISLNRQIETTDWNDQSRRMIGKSPEAKAINSYLDAIEFRIYEIYKQLVADGAEITGELIKAKFIGLDTDKPRMLLEIFEVHNKQFEELVGKDFAEGTLKRFKVVKKAMEEFLEWKFQMKDISIKKLNFEFINDFEFYLKSVRNCGHNTVMSYIKKLRELNYQFITDYEFFLKTVRNVEHNTAMGTIKKLKKIIRICVAHDWMEKDPFMNYKVKVRETNRPFLLQDDLDKIIALKFTAERLTQVRDIFVFCCYTGLAYADVQKLKRIDIVIGHDGEKWIHTERVKTETATRVPLLLKH